MPYPATTYYPGATTVYPATLGSLPFPALGGPWDTWRAVELHYSDGRVKRFGPDERFDADIPYAIQFDTQMPGGFGTGGLVLARPPKLRADDAALFSHAVIYGPHGTDYEGRVTGVPQVGSEEIRLELEGHSAALDDDQTWRALIVDIDLSHWGPASVERRVLANSAGYASYDPGVVTDTATGFPALEQRFNARWGANAAPANEAWYDARGLPLYELDFAWKKNANVDPGGADTNWAWTAELSTDDIKTDSDGSATNLRAPGPGTGTRTATASDRRYAMLQFRYDAANTGVDESTEYALWWTVAGVHGYHGLTPRGTVTTQGARGYYGSDVLGYVLEGTGLNYTLGDSIEQSTFAIPHLVFLEPGPRRRAVEQITALSSAPLPNDWGVYERKEFFHKTPGSYGKTWRIRRDQVATPTSEGPQAKGRLGGVMISYRDGSGRTHSVGPPGSGAEYETTDLLDSDPQNPANRLTRKWRHEQIGITNQEGAVRAGQMLLADSNQITWQGSTVIRGEATDSAGNTSPASRIRAGDRVVIEDDEYPSELPIASTSYGHDDLEAKVDIGAPPNTTETLLAQLEAATDLTGA